MDSLPSQFAEKILKVLKLIRDVKEVPDHYFKKLVNSSEIWEARVSYGTNTFRLLGFWHQHQFIVLTNGFKKKTQKTPLREIKLAEKRKADFIQRSKNG